MATVADGHLTKGDEMSGVGPTASMAALASGGFVRISSASTGATVTIYDAAGHQIGQAITLAEVTGFPAIVGLASGGFAVAWHAGSFDTGNPHLATQAFDAAGTALGPATTFTPNFNYLATNPSLAARPDGSYVITWTQQGATLSDGVSARVFAADGAPIGNATTVVAPGASTASGAFANNAVTLSDGRVLIGYTARTQNGFSSATSVTGVRVINTDGTLATFANGSTDLIRHGGSIDSDSINGVATVLASGTILFTWLEAHRTGNDTTYDLHGEELDASGNLNGNSFTLPAALRFSVAALDHDAFLVTYITADGQVVGQAYDANAVAAGTSFTLNAADEFNLNTPIVTAFGTADAAVSWNYDYSSSGSVELFYSATPFPSADQVLTGTSGPDTLTGHAGNDTIDGGDGNDALDGANGNDTLSGGPGDDQIRGGGGNDLISGDAGNDKLYGGSGSDTIHGGDGIDTIDGFGETTGTDQHADSLFGDDGDDRLTIHYGDSVDGGAGTDTFALDFRGGSAGVTADLGQLVGNGTITIAGGTITGMESVSDIKLTDFDDDLTVGAIAIRTIFNSGPQFPLTIDAGGGNDHITGGATSEILHGGAGDDVLRGGDGGNDFLYGDDGNDILYAGNGGAFALGGAGDDIVFGGAYSDAIAGDAGNDTLSGGAGNDSFDGGAGDDVLTGGAGDDYVDGGDGNDVAIFNVSSAAATISVAYDGTIVVTSSEGTDQVRNVETLRFTDRDIVASGLTINGTTGADTLNGTALADTIFGDAGNDSLLGMGGDDVLNGGSGNDLLDGGDGSDVVLLSTDRTVVRFSPGANGDVILTSTVDGTDTLRNVEAIRFSGGEQVALSDLVLFGTAGADTLTATASRQLIMGFDGNDTLSAGSTMNVVLDGGNGNDLLIAGSGLDTMTGGAGFDTFEGTIANLTSDIITDFGPGDRIHVTDRPASLLFPTLTGSYLSMLGGSMTVQVSGAIYANKLSVADNPAGGADIMVLARTVLNDFNGDGRSDILWRSASGQLSDWLGQANGGFANNDGNALTGAPTSWKVVGTGDFNGDGRSDILWRNDSGLLSDWLGKANGGFVGNDGNAMTNVPTNWHVVGTGDFNGDGRSDILWRNDNGQLSDWLGQANGGFVGNDANAMTSVPTSWKVVDTGDFNGDGRADILWRNDNGQLSDWLGKANGGFVGNDANAMTSVPTSWKVAGTGDFNGDGQTDILWRNDNGQLSDWLGTVFGGFLGNDARALTNVPTNWRVVETGDYNGDGRDDILWRNDSGQLSNWLGQANGGFVGNDGNAMSNVPTSWATQPVHDLIV